MNTPYKQAIYYCFLYILLASLLVSPAFAQIAVRTDRTALNTQESLTLTLEIAGADQPLPELSSLRRDFRISSSQRSSIFRHASGSREASTRWQIQLQPLRSGTLTIPALEAGGHSSSPLMISVSGQASSPTTSPARSTAGLPAESSRTEFSTVELDRQQVYEGAQLLYRASFYHPSPLPADSLLNPPGLAQGTVHPLGPRREYVEQFDQRSYHVTEQFFALFPTAPGPQLISGASLTAPDNGYETAFRLAAEDIEVEVLPLEGVSAEGRSQAARLPAAEQLVLHQDLIKSDLLPDSLLLSLSLTATALGRDQLPDALYPYAPIPGASLLSRQHDETPHAVLGLTGSLRETWLITPEQSGVMTLPPLTLHWWNTLEAREELVSTPRTSIDVHLSTPASTADSAAAGNPAADALPRQASLIILFLSGVSLLASLGWLYSYIYFRRRLNSRAGASSRSRRSANAGKPERRVTPASAPAQNSSQASLRERDAQIPGADSLSITAPARDVQATGRSEQEAFEVLMAACEANDALLSSRALQIWAARFWPDAGITELGSIGQAAGHQTLGFLIVDLEHHLYSEEIDLWQGDLLLKAVTALRKRRRNREDDTLALFDLSVASER